MKTPKLNNLGIQELTIRKFIGYDERYDMPNEAFSNVNNLEFSETTGVTTISEPNDTEDFSFTLPVGSETEPRIYPYNSKFCFIVVTEKTGNIYKDVIYLYNKTTKTGTSVHSAQYPGLPLHERIVSFTMFSDKAIFLYKTNVISTATTGFHIIAITPDYEIGIALPEKQTVIIPTGLMVSENGNYKISAKATIVSFINRLAICYKDNVYISYYNNITKWDTYTNALGEVSGETCETLTMTDNDGYFTTAINYGGYPVFFKKTAMYMLRGEQVPFSLVKVASVGASECLVLNDVLYFLNSKGLMQYTSGYPKLISERIVSAKSGVNLSTDGERLYFFANGVSLSYFPRLDVFSKYETSFQNIFGFDTKYSIQYIGTVGINQPNMVTGVAFYSNKEVSSNTNWHFETKKFSGYTEHQKRVVGFALGVETFGENTKELLIKVSLNGGTYNTVYSDLSGNISYLNKRIDIMLSPCDNFKIAVFGKGQIEIEFIKIKYRFLR